MSRFLRFLIFNILTISLLSCSSQTDDLAVSSQAIRLSADGDQFLKNFVVPEPGGLSIGLSYEEALFAGASKAGYAELESQIEQINKEYDAKSYKYWTDAIRQQHVATKSTAMNVSREGYDKYYVLPQDRFLGNFLYCEDGKVVLKISEEKAVLCGATAEGYRILRDETITPNNIWDKMVEEGQVTYEKIRESFDHNREFILRYGNLFSEVTTKIPPVNPPQTYAIIELKNNNRQETCVFFGAEEIMAYISSNYWLASAVLEELETAKTLNLIGSTSTYGTFKAGLVYPEGGHYTFRFTKLVDSYDVTARLAEIQQPNEIL